MIVAEGKLSTRTIRVYGEKMLSEEPVTKAAVDANVRSGEIATERHLIA